MLLIGTLRARTAMNLEILFHCRIISGEVDTSSCAMCFLFGVLASLVAKPDMVQRRTDEQVPVPRSCTKVIEGLVVNRISEARRRRHQDQIHCSRSAGRCWRRHTNVFQMIWEGQTTRQERCGRTNFDMPLSTIPAQGAKNRRRTAKQTCRLDFGNRA